MIHFIVSFITHCFHSFDSFLSVALGSSLPASPVWEVWFRKATGIVSGERCDLCFRNLPTLSLSLLSCFFSPLSFLKPQICLLFHSCHQLNQGTGGGVCVLLTPMTFAVFIAVSVLGGAALISGRNSRVMNVTLMHRSTGTLLCHHAWVERASAIGPVPLWSCQWSGAGWRRGGGWKRLYLWGEGAVSCRIGGGNALCGMWPDSDHLCWLD